GRSQPTFVKSVNAQPGDTVDFQMVLTTGGGSSVNNVNISDVLPGGLTFVTGSVTQNGSAASDNLVTGSGINLGTLSPNSNIPFQFSARVTASSAVTLDNTVNVSSSASNPS